MTCQAVRRLRRRSKLRPTGASASDRLKATYKAWGLLMTTYRNWAAKQADARDPAGVSPVSLRWVGSFDDFVDDMGLRPDGTLLAAIDPRRPLGPGNCHWAEPGSPGRRGRKASSCLTHDGQTRTITEWSSLLGIPYQTIYTRIKRGATSAQALALTGERS
jgi:hypothetical protein